jgi:MoxR-like ATPase
MLEENNELSMGDPVTPVDNTSEIIGVEQGQLDQFKDKIDAIKSECQKLLIGQEELVELLIINLLCNGHVLLEGVPGVAKTLTAKVISKTIDSGFSRIQFTPDLMPTDILGTSIFNMKEGSFDFRKGPIFSNIILIDEINRAPAKTQAALFEVMEERQITYDGVVYDLAFPFIIIATQNPVEQEGTYRLPEAQLDRFFMKLNMTYPNYDDEVNILHRFKDDTGRPDVSSVNAVCSAQDLSDIQNKLSSVFLADNIVQYIVTIVQATRNHGKIFLGASPRASLGIMKAAKAVAMLSSRSFVIPDDVQYVTPHILNHRLILTPEAEMSGQTVTNVVDQILKETEVPR